MDLLSLELPNILASAQFVPVDAGRWRGQEENQ